MPTEQHVIGPQTIDLTGQRFQRLLVARFAGTSRRGAARWECLCDCGQRRVVFATSLRQGTTRSCGCLWREEQRQRSAVLNRTHGRSKTPEYKTWLAMRRRCTNPRDTAAHAYLDRGISVCARWADSFEAFHADMGPKPSRAHTLERTDNDAGYWCGHCDECRAKGRAANCCWATRAVQARNTRKNILVSYQGRTMCAAELARLPECAVAQATVQRRLAAGWAVERAVTTPSLTR